MTAPSASARVLAVDDSLAMRELINFVLSNAGYQVSLAEDGLAGLEQLERVRPDIIITDVNMPRMNGLDFIADARKRDHCRSTPILVLTTESDGAKKLRAKEAGATGWIVKPFSPNQLLEVVRRVAA